MQKFTVNEAIGFTVNQYLFAQRVTKTQLAAALGIAQSNASKKVLGKSGWAAEDLIIASTLLGVSPQDLLPTSDGMGGWIPAPYVPAHTKKNPTPVGVGSSEVVAGAGFEPTTSGL